MYQFPNRRTVPSLVLEEQQQQQQAGAHKMAAPQNVRARIPHLSRLFLCLFASNLTFCAKNSLSQSKTTELKGQFHGFAHVQSLALAVVNFTVSY